MILGLTTPAVLLIGLMTSQPVVLVVSAYASRPCNSIGRTIAAMWMTSISHKAPFSMSIPQHPHLNQDSDVSHKRQLAPPAIVALGIARRDMQLKALLLDLTFIISARCARYRLPLVFTELSTIKQEATMADKRSGVPNENHVADDAAGKGIQARVNTPSDPHTEGSDQSDDGQTQVDEAAASGDLTAVNKAKDIHAESRKPGSASER